MAHVLRAIEDTILNKYGIEQMRKDVELMTKDLMLYGVYLTKDGNRVDPRSISAINSNCVEGGI